MAGYRSLASVALSVVNLLNAAFAEDEPVDATAPATAALVATQDFKLEDDTRIPAVGVSVFPYRVELNRTMRPGWSGVGSLDGGGHLPLDVHVLVTAWGANPEHELQILGRAMQCLESTPILSGPALTVLGGWSRNEAVQVVVGEITTEEIMRTFDSLPGPYKLSVPYILRGVRIDTPRVVRTEVGKVITGLVPSASA